MFCTNCGNQVPDGTKFCPSCGAALGGNTSNATFEQKVENVAGSVKSDFAHAENEFGSAVGEIRDSFNGTTGERLKDDRGLLSYILLTIITCGIYGYYFIYKMAHDVNIACEGDGEETSGLVAFILLSFITCGIYSWIWQYKLGNRLANNAPRYGFSFQENGTTVLMWNLFGSLLCGIGPFIAMNILIKNSNNICGAYNRAHGL